MGNGYTAVYGQLKEVPLQIGDYVGAGELIGYVSEPTKYYSVEGANLYFEVQKDGVPVNPLDFMVYLVHDSLQARKRLCAPAQLRRANPTPIRWIA